MSTSKRSLVLEFGPQPQDVREDLSVVAVFGDHLWLAADETTSIERLSFDGTYTFTHHKSFPLLELIDLPIAETGEEIDIEGIAFEANYLWLVGSHSLKRKKVEESDQGSDQEKIEKLTKITGKGNRYLLARIPVSQSGSNGPQLVRSCPDPADSARELTAARLAGDATGDKLTEALKTDPHLGLFLSIPSKDNGLDIEGLAISGSRIFLGLRSPVLRGWAVILEIELEDIDSSTLALKSIGQGGKPYRKHFLQLEGLGVRELCVDGEDMLILAGPSMELDGPVYVFRWQGGAKAPADSLVGRSKLEEIVAVPYGRGSDHAEGISLFDNADQRSLLVVYDSPGGSRKLGRSAVIADLFELS
jgi:hypothetical protein